MAPKPKPNPNRLGPPPQLNSLKMFPVVHQKFAKKMQPKMREVVTRHIKILAKWFHTQFSWKKFLLFWMVLLIASKMVLLMLTYQFFSLTSLVSLEVSIKFDILSRKLPTVTPLDFSFMNNFDIFCDKWRCLGRMVPLIWISTSEIWEERTGHRDVIWLERMLISFQKTKVKFLLQPVSLCQGEKPREWGLDNSIHLKHVTSLALIAKYYQLRTNVIKMSISMEVIKLTWQSKSMQWSVWQLTTVNK